MKENIEPLVTMYHWDLPQYIQDIGGWTNPIIVDYFTAYADVLFEQFGSRVKRWITLNEPAIFCGAGYGHGSDAPDIRSPGVGDYICGHHALLANAAAYRLYKTKYFDEQRGQVGICLNSNFNYPLDDTVDPSYAEKAMEFELGKFSNAIFSKDGGYPQIMIDKIGNKSVAEGRPWSRLPAMSDEIKKHIRSTADFLGLNYYTSRLTAPRAEETGVQTSWSTDNDLDFTVDPSWHHAKSNWLYSVPQGLHDILKWIKDKYDNPIVMITENGWSDDGQLDDEERVEYLKVHLAAITKAINDDKCNVVAYTAWSLTDNYEWVSGYTQKFGIHYIDFSSPAKERVPKNSAKFLKELMLTKSFKY